MVAFYWVMGVLIVGTFVAVRAVPQGEPGCPPRRAKALWNFTRVLTLFGVNLLIWGHIGRRTLADLVRQAAKGWRDRRPARAGSGHRPQTRYDGRRQQQPPRSRRPGLAQRRERSASAGDQQRTARLERSSADRGGRPRPRSVPHPWPRREAIRRALKQSKSIGWGQRSANPACSASATRVGRAWPSTEPTARYTGSVAVAGLARRAVQQQYVAVGQLQR